MDYSINKISILSENCLLRVIADFNSSLGLRSAIFSLGKTLNEKISDKIIENSEFSELKITESGKFSLCSKFYNYREFRIKVINLLKWIQQNGSTDSSCNLYIDLKLVNKTEGPFKGTMFFKGNSVENINKLKFILSFDESKIRLNFSERTNKPGAKTIKDIEPSNRVNSVDSILEDPNQYRIINSEQNGINFNTLSRGFVRMQYLGGYNYENKISKILDIIHMFVECSYDCIINKEYTEENLQTFRKLIDRYKKVQKSYKNYKIFKSEYSNIKFTVNLLEDERVLSQFYDILKDQIYNLISNLKFKLSDEWKLNYDSLAKVLQIKDAKLICKNIEGIEFINCEIKDGLFKQCDFYLSEIKNSSLMSCNIFRETLVFDSILSDSFSNRTTLIKNCEIGGENSVTNSKVEGGIILNTKLGKFADISKTTKVIKYKELKTGFIVAADKIINKNPNKIRVK